MKIEKIIDRNIENACVALAMNINKTYLIPKIDNFDKYNLKNQVLLISSILENEYSSGEFYTNKYIKENNLEFIKERNNGTFLTYKNQEKYTYYYVYNRDLFILEDKVPQNPEINIDVKDLKEYILSSEFDNLEKVFMCMYIKALLGIYIKTDIKYDTDSKNIIKYLAMKNYYKNFIACYKKAKEYIDKYLENIER